MWEVSFYFYLPGDLSSYTLEKKSPKIVLGSNEAPCSYYSIWCCNKISKVLTPGCTHAQLPTYIYLSIYLSTCATSTSQSINALLYSIRKDKRNKQAITSPQSAGSVGPLTCMYNYIQPTSDSRLGMSLDIPRQNIYLHMSRVTNAIKSFHSRSRYIEIPTIPT